jgi:hypothetical protein
MPITLKAGKTLPVLAYADTHLCYCPTCAHRLGYNDPRKWGPNWLPFIAIFKPDDLPEKYCDACAEPLALG